MFLVRIAVYSIHDVVGGEGVGREVAVLGGGGDAVAAPSSVSLAWARGFPLRCPVGSSPASTRRIMSCHSAYWVPT